MNVSKSFSYAFEDREWLVKFIIFGVLAFIPILFFANLGYIIELIRNVSDRKTNPLPDCNNFGQKFVDGFLLSISYNLYFLPGIVVFFVPLLFLVIPAASGNEDLQSIAAIAASGWALIFTCLLIVYYSHAPK